jgi:hypothetical protein
MTAPPTLQLWQHGMLTCRITPVSKPPPYFVVIHDGDDAIADRSFDTHDEALSFALEELRRAKTASPPQPT